MRRLFNLAAAGAVALGGGIVGAAALGAVPALGSSAAPAPAPANSDDGQVGNTDVNQGDQGTAGDKAEPAGQADAPEAANKDDGATGQQGAQDGPQTP